MRTATSVLTVLTACVVTVAISVSLMGQANDHYASDQMMDQTAVQAAGKHHEAASADFSAEASQLVVDRA